VIAVGLYVVGWEKGKGRDLGERKGLWQFISLINSTDNTFIQLDGASEEAFGTTVGLKRSRKPPKNS
jgi:hypothetical protein